ncbi:DNA replication protein [Actinomortierella ambigua]|uniref:DNA replication complex GINS protein PSF3 n=1 Tax=Actinomortierella ambigua TaxID=1343610 RepID=A0A9P6UD34_9FUNG|nr:DNA replication protein [Actinomortierella ambigua]
MEDYYDIDSILAEDQKVKCVFQDEVPGLSWLEGGYDDVLRARSKVDLPFWLAREIIDHPEGVVPLDLETPEFFGAKVRNGLRAEATMVDLPKLCPQFFRFGIHFLHLVDDASLSKVLAQAFKARLQTTMDHAQSGGNKDFTDYLSRLDETERELYKAGLESCSSLHQWNNQSLGRIRSASEMVLKRKYGQ